MEAVLSGQNLPEECAVVFFTAVTQGSMFLSYVAACLKFRAASHPNTALQCIHFSTYHPVADSATGEIAERATPDPISQRKQLEIHFHLLYDVGSDTPPLMQHVCQGMHAL